MSTVRCALWRALLAVCGGLLLACVARSAEAQFPTAGLTWSVGADRERLAELSGRSEARAPESASRVRVIPPTIRISWNSSLPSGGNDGPLWAGRGANVNLTGGVSYARRWSRLGLTAAIAPSLSFSANEPFFVIGDRSPHRSGFASPFHHGRFSADLPTRFGDAPMLVLDPGQSSIAVYTDRIAVGAATSTEWWGPALRNALVLSTNAPGIPRLFVGSQRPLTTGLGSFEGRLIAGVLIESPFFDDSPSNDVRTVSGMVVAFHPRFDPGLTLGVTRMVVAPSRRSFEAAHALDVLSTWEPPRAASDTLPGGESRQRVDQLVSVYARWVFPSSGFETYLEWARSELPRSAREFLLVPQNSQAYTIGLQWVSLNPRGVGPRVQAEVSYLEQNLTVTDRLTPDYYTGRAAPQGFTNRGQVLGASIGPGAAAQFVAADWMAPTWQIGTFVGRTRMENDAYYRLLPAPGPVSHDVTIYGGARTGLRRSRMDVLAEVTVGTRLNYLFQGPSAYLTSDGADDVRNISLNVMFSPR